jgi:hypothetical protein
VLQRLQAAARMHTADSDTQAMIEGFKQSAHGPKGSALSRVGSDTDLSGQLTPQTRKRRAARLWSKTPPLAKALGVVSFLGRAASPQGGGAGAAVAAGGQSDPNYPMDPKDLPSDLQEGLHEHEDHEVDWNYHVLDHSPEQLVGAIMHMLDEWRLVEQVPPRPVPLLLHLR